MYNVTSRSIALFVMLDMIALVLSYYVVGFLYGNGFIFGNHSYYEFEWLFLILLSNLLTNPYHEITIRGYLKECQYTLSYVAQVMIVLGFMTIFHDPIVKGNSFHSDRVWFLILLASISFALVYGFRIFGKYLKRKMRTKTKKVLLITRFKNGQAPQSVLGSDSEICAYIDFNETVLVYQNRPVLHHIEMIRQFMSENVIDEIYVDASTLMTFQNHLKDMKELGIPITIDLTELTTQFPGVIAVRQMGNRFVITSAANIATLRQLFVKRLMDIVGGMVGTLLCLIVGIMIYPRVQKESPGPMIFKQKRVAKNGKIFYVYKFRSMYLDAEERKQELLSKNELDTTLMFKMKNDPRVFPFGQILRDWSLDELPQFVNVLKGEMSLVGTRPPTLEEYKNYEMHHFKRLAVKPGITGLWQVSGRSDITDFEEVVSLDYRYIQNWSISLDIKILAQTLRVVLLRKGSR